MIASKVDVTQENPTRIIANNNLNFLEETRSTDNEVKRASSGRVVETNSTSHDMPNRPNLSIDADQANMQNNDLLVSFDSMASLIVS